MSEFKKIFCLHWLEYYLNLSSDAIDELRLKVIVIDTYFKKDSVGELIKFYLFHCYALKILSNYLPVKISDLIYFQPCINTFAVVHLSNVSSEKQQIVREKLHLQDECTK